MTGQTYISTERPLSSIDTKGVLRQLQREEEQMLVDSHKSSNAIINISGYSFIYSCIRLSLMNCSKRQTQVLQMWSFHNYKSMANAMETISVCFIMTIGTA